MNRMNLKHALLAALCATAFAPPAAHAVVVIDDFSGGAATLTTNAGSPAAVGGTQTGSMAGGYRAVTLSAWGDANSTAQVAIGNGLFDFASTPGVTHARFDWMYGNASGVYFPLNLDLSGQDRLRFSFDSLASGLDMSVSLAFASYGSYGNEGSVRQFLAPSATPFNVDFLFSDFAKSAPAANFADVDRIHIVLRADSPQGGGQAYAISSIAAVPEPESYALMLAGLGFVGMVARRRKTGSI